MEMELLEPTWPLRRPKWFPTWAIASCRRMEQELERPPVYYQSPRQRPEVGSSMATQTAPEPKPRRWTQGVQTEATVLRHMASQTATEDAVSVGTQTDPGLVIEPMFLIRLLLEQASEQGASAIPALTRADELMNAYSWHHDLMERDSPIGNQTMGEMFAGWNVEELPELSLSLPSTCSNWSDEAAGFFDR